MAQKKLKIVISHDIDHLGVSEHLFKDLIIPKYFIWSFLELLNQKISLNTFIKKIKEIFLKNGWNNLGELLTFDQEQNLNPTFFIAVDNGKGLSYSLRQAKKAINLIKSYNFNIGIHGICYDDYERMKKEKLIFKKISKLNNFGIRMHYLRESSATQDFLTRLGYLFSSSKISKKLEQKKIGKIIELPFHLMDSYLFNFRSNLDLEKAKKITIDLLNKAENEGKDYFAVTFHQRHFSETFPKYKKWYLWFVSYCKKQNFEFKSLKELL
jgi:hypothetical protein